MIININDYVWISNSNIRYQKRYIKVFILRNGRFEGKRYLFKKDTKNDTSKKDTFRKKRPNRNVGEKRLLDKQQERESVSMLETCDK